jgi:transcriptional regulator with XRE-family HTH domain
MFGQVCWIVRAYVGKIERGEVNVSVRTAYKLARALGTTLSSML